MLKKLLKNKIFLLILFTTPRFQSKFEGGNVIKVNKKRKEKGEKDVRLSLSSAVPPMPSVEDDHINSFP